MDVARIGFCGHLQLLVFFFCVWQDFQTLNSLTSFRPWKADDMLIFVCLMFWHSVYGWAGSLCLMFQFMAALPPLSYSDLRWALTPCFFPSERLRGKRLEGFVNKFPRA
jgi:hypothetical protein